MFTVNDNNEAPLPKPILVNSSPILHTTSLTDSASEFNEHSSQTNMDDFEIKQPIGYGSSAIVYSAVYLPFNKRVAIKVIDLDMFERNQIDGLRRETSLMALSKHQHILRVYGSFVHGSKLYIVTPYMAVGSCLDIIKTRYPEGLDEISIATILKQALEGLAYLHKNGHIHRDVKAGNLLMDEDGTVLLADFGVSSSLMETGERGMRKTFVGTPCWMAPEVMEQADYDYKADIWSFGITAIELATGHAPFAKHPPLKVLMLTLNNDPPTLDRERTTNKYTKTFKDLIDSCMNKDPTKRPSAEKLLLHPFFKQAKKPEWLSKNLIVDIPPIESRPLKKIPQKKVVSTNTDEWDFDEEQQQQQQQQQMMPGLHAPKRHISFGHVVVRKPSHHASESWSHSTEHSSFSANRKGRALSDDFIMESSRIAASKNHAPNAIDELNKRGNNGSRYNLNGNRARHGSLHERTPTVTFSEATNKSLYRTISHDENMNRKGSRLSPPPQSSIILSRNNSTKTGSSLTRESSTHSESRKVGRFELTSNESSRQTSYNNENNAVSSPSSASSQNVSTVIQDLLKQNETQAHLLNELYALMKQPSQQDVIESLEQQLQAYQRENLLLQRENEIMRRQIEQLKNSK